MADQVLTASGSNSAIVPEVWSALFQNTLNDSIVFPSIVRRDYEGEIAGRGDTVRIPSIADVTATDLGDGARNDAVTITATTTSLVVDSIAAVDFKISTLAELQSVPHMERLRVLAEQAIMRKLQDDIVAAVAPSTSAPDHTISYTTGSTLADADILAALDLEGTANWSQSTDRYLVTGALQYNDLMGIAKFYDQTLGGNVSVAAGAATGKIYGHTPMQSTACGTTTYLFDGSFMQMAIQRGLNITLTDLAVLGERGYRLNVDLIYGIKQVHSTRVITIG
jgi:hypothetical protein